MKRSVPLRADPAKTKNWQRRSHEPNPNKPRLARRRPSDGPWREECLRVRGAYCRACGPPRVVDGQVVNPAPEPELLQLDHIIPRSQGGPSIVENGLVLGGPFTCGHHDLKTAHRLLIQRAWLDPDQIDWLRDEGHVVWLLDGSVEGRHHRLFAPVMEGNP